MFNFCHIIIYQNTLHSDLDYLADVNAGIIKSMQTVDPQAVWYVSVSIKENNFLFLI
jgi:hypothetical protein